MSGGTPIGGGLMRQRHSQGYGSGGDDLEDDASSRPPPQFQLSQRNKTWVEVIELVIWIGSVVFIVYFGDRHSNLIYLLCHDDRIRRTPLYIGMLGIILNLLFFLYTSTLAWGVRKSSEKWEISSASALPFVTVLGLISFCLFTFALWPIWSFLTVPLVFTLFMACMVILPHVVLKASRPPADVLRID